MTALPDNFELLKLVQRGWNQEQIAEEFGVTQQAVSKRLNAMNVYMRGGKSPITSLIPWDLSDRDDKERLFDSAAFRGFRDFLRSRAGETLPKRGAMRVRSFLNHINAGEVLAFDEANGFVYVPRTDADGDLLIRWPDEVKRSTDPAVVRMLSRQGVEEQ